MVLTCVLDFACCWQALTHVDKLSAVVAISQTLVAVPFKISENKKQNRFEHVQCSSSFLRWQTKPVVKGSLGFWKLYWRQSRLILQKAMGTLMIRLVYFFCLLLTLTCCDPVLRKLRITSALFVCWKRRRQDKQTLFLAEITQGHPQHLPSKLERYSFCSPFVL